MAARSTLEREYDTSPDEKGEPVESVGLLRIWSPTATELESQPVQVTIRTKERTFALRRWKYDGRTYRENLTWKLWLEGVLQGHWTD